MLKFSILIILIAMKILSQVNIGKFGVRPGNFSGITPIGDNRYAVVDDKEDIDGFQILTIDMNLDNGKLRHVSYSEPSGFAQRKAETADAKQYYRDCEGCAYCSQRNSVFVSGEEHQDILEYDMNGLPTGAALRVPEYMKRDAIAENYGFEALTYNSTTQTFWTTTESTLLGDGLRSSLEHRVANRLRLQSFGLDLNPGIMFPYMMDAPTTKKKKGEHIHGVPSMLALDDGRIIVMEREAMIPRLYFGSFCKVKLYVVNPQQEASKAISASTSLSDLPSEAFLTKELLCSFATHVSTIWNFANYEGMCLGPKLNDGRQTLILISDSQGGHGNAIYHLKDYLRVVIL